MRLQWCSGAERPDQECNARVGSMELDQPFFVPSYLYKTLYCDTVFIQFIKNTLLDFLKTVSEQNSYRIEISIPELSPFVTFAHQT